MANKILSYHANPNALHWDDFKSFMVQYRANTCTIYANGGRAVELARLCPWMLVMSRPEHDAYKTSDGRILSPSEWIQATLVLYAPVGPLPENLVFNTPNEPAPDDPAYEQWLVGVMAEADKAGIRLAVQMGSVGTPGIPAMEGEIYEPLIRALAGSRHILCLHEYSMVSLWWDEVLMDDYFTPEQFFTNNGYYLDEKRILGKLPEQNHIGRFMWWNIRAREFGVEPPTIWINEFGMDRCNDIENRGQILDWEKNYAPRFPDGAKQFRGAESYAALWGAMRPDLDWRDFYWEQVQWYLDQLPPNVIGVDMFMAEESGKWKTNGFNVWGPEWGGFEKHMIEYQKESEEPQVTPNWQRGQLTVVNASTLYKRADATTSSNKLGTLVAGAPYVLYRDMAFSAEMDGFNWAKLASSLDAQPFYVATKYIDWQDDAAPAPAPTPSPISDLETWIGTYFTADNIEALKRARDLISAFITAFEDRN